MDKKMGSETDAFPIIFALSGIIILILQVIIGISVIKNDGKKGLTKYRPKQKTTGSDKLDIKSDSEKP